MKKLAYLLPVVLMCCFACTPDSQQQNPSNDDENNNPSQNDNLSPEGWYETNYWQRSDREKAGFRGPVKKWYLSKSNTHREYNYNEAGNITLIRDVNPESSRGEWMEQRFYDNNGRLVKKIWGRSTQKGEIDFDEWASYEV